MGTAVGRVARGASSALACALLSLSFLAALARAEPVPVPSGFPSKVEELPIRSARVGPQAVVVTLSSGYCAGAPYRPYIERVTLRWSRDGATRFRAILTARVRTPVYPPLPPSTPSAAEGPATVQVCAGIGLDLRAKVELPKPVGRTELFDGSTSPPTALHVYPSHS